MQSSVRECSYRTLLGPTDLSLKRSCLYRALRQLTSQHQWPQLSPRSPAGPLLASFFWRTVGKPRRVSGALSCALPSSGGLAVC